VGIFGESVGTAAVVRRSEAAGLTVIVPYATLRQLHDNREVDVVYMRAATAGAVPQVMQIAERVLAARHRSMESIEVESLKPFLDLALRVSQAITLVLLAVAGISLVVGGIGIMNIMLVTVRERTRDIGIRMAIGARRRDILIQFLLEAALLSMVGGVIGVALGGGLPLLVGALLGVQAPISAWSVGVAFAVCVAVGLIFGVQPARKAAGMNIVDSLAYE
jgi:putative ABC transport system permease protein